jgi:pimeloyl-ACP methyl ester carboxylesterase
MGTALPRDRTAPARLHGRLAASVAGAGPVVMLVHGVAYGPQTLTETARAVAAAGACAVVPHRAGYGRSSDVAPGAGLDSQIDDLVAVLDDVGAGHAVWVGVSGGATIALAAALRRPERVAGALLHEPAIGALADDLHARLLAAAAAVAAADDAGAAAVDLARALGGAEGWAGVSEALRHDIRAAGAAVRAEIALFPAFAPTPAALGRLRDVPLVSSVGARSGPERHRAGEVLAALTGATPALTPSGHLVQIEAPAVLAELSLGLVRRAQSRPATAEEDG